MKVGNPDETVLGSMSGGGGTGAPARLLEQTATDLRWAARALRNSPAFTLVAVASLALGIGFNAAMFTLVDSILFRPGQLERPHELAGC